MYPESSRATAAAMARASAASANVRVRRAVVFMGIAPGRFELPSRVPKTRMLGRYTTGLRRTDSPGRISPLCARITMTGRERDFRAGAARTSVHPWVSTKTFTLRSMGRPVFSNCAGRSATLMFGLAFETIMDPGHEEPPAASQPQSRPVFPRSTARNPEHELRDRAKAAKLRHRAAKARLKATHLEDRSKHLRTKADQMERRANELDGVSSSGRSSTNG